jgi:hypothetical protein
MLYEKGTTYYEIHDELDNGDVEVRVLFSLPEALHEYGGRNKGPERVGIKCEVLKEKVQVIEEIDL